MNPFRWARVLQASIVLAVFLPVLIEWAEYAGRVGRLSYALLVPVLAGILALLTSREQRGALRSMQERPSKPSTLCFAGLLLSSSGLLAAGSLTGLFTLSILAFPVAVSALVCGWFGAGALRRYAPALLLLAFMVPIPMPLLGRANPYLIEASGTVAVTLLSLFDSQADWVGSTLFFEGWSVEVEEACSGSGTTVTLFVLTVFLAGLFRLRPLAALAALSASVPLSLLVNGTRIATSAVCLDRFGRESATGLPHEILGQLLLLGGATMLVLLASRLDPRTRPEHSEGAA